MTLRRREALAVAGAGGLALMLGAGRGLLADAIAADPAASLAGACTLTKELTEGPYWIDNNLTRRNITGGKHGMPLALVFTVRDASTCAVIPGADVEVWHADAAGVYSGFSAGPASAVAAGTPQNSRRFLRGHQRADSRGRARFDTIYPGWYSGRTPHIHLKVHVGGEEVHTGQVFFPDKLSTAVYRTARYRSRGTADTTNAADSIYDRGSLLTVSRRGAGKGYLATTTLAVNRG
jgi:protocatechuate 3,4-dioxygenase beta subunit